MLIDDIQKSKELGEKYIRANVSEKHLKDVEHIRTKISEMLPSIVMVFSSVNELKTIVQTPTVELERLRGQLKSLKDEISSLEREQIIKKLDDITFLKNQSNAKLEQEWNRYRSDHHSKNANMIHSILNVIDADSRLDELGTLGKAINSKKIGDLDTVTKIKKYQKICQEIIKDLKMEPEVEEFIMKLSRGDELLLSDISDEIMKWLLIHNVSKKIKISI